MNNNLRARTDFIVVHSTKTKPSQNLSAKDITLKHRKEGFFHNAFHFVIKRDGTVEEGRPEDMSGAILPINQPLITNQNSIAIGLVGGLSDDGQNLDTNFTFQQYSSLRELVKKLKKIERYMQNERNLTSNAYYTDVNGILRDVNKEKA